MTLRSLLFLALLAATTLPLGAARADTGARPGFDDAYQAYIHGDYAHALAGLRPLAKAGYARAQYQLGQLYDNGLGVRQDYAEAASWYRKAAAQGNALAEERLGDLYAEGLGVKRNDREAYIWLDRAAAKTTGAHQWLIEQERHRVAVRMTPAELAQAKEEAARAVVTGRS